MGQNAESIAAQVFDNGQINEAFKYQIHKADVAEAAKAQEQKDLEKDKRAEINALLDMKGSAYIPHDMEIEKQRNELIKEATNFGVSHKRGYTQYDPNDPKQTEAAFNIRAKVGQFEQQVSNSNQIKELIEGQYKLIQNPSNVDKLENVDKFAEFVKLPLAQQTEIFRSGKMDEYMVKAKPPTPNWFYKASKLNPAITRTVTERDAGDFLKTSDNQYINVAQTKEKAKIYVESGLMGSNKDAQQLIFEQRDALEEDPNTQILPEAEKNAKAKEAAEKIVYDLMIANGKPVSKLTLDNKPKEETDAGGGGNSWGFGGKSGWTVKQINPNPEFDVLTPDGTNKKGVGYANLAVPKTSTNLPVGAVIDRGTNKTLVSTDKNIDVEIGQIMIYKVDGKYQPMALGTAADGTSVAVPLGLVEGALNKKAPTKWAFKAAESANNGVKFDDFIKEVGEVERNASTTTTQPATTTTPKIQPKTKPSTKANALP